MKESSLDYRTNLPKQTAEEMHTVMADLVKAIGRGQLYLRLCRAINSSVNLARQEGKPASKKKKAT